MADFIPSQFADLDGLVSSDQIPAIVTGAKSFQEPTGAGGISASFGRNKSGSFQPLVDCHTQNTAINSAINPDVIHNKPGRGTILLWDWVNTDGSARLTPRGAAFGTFDYGMGIYAVAPSDGDVLEFAPGTGGTATRTNVPGCNRNFHEIRRPVDDSGLMLASTTQDANTTNDGNNSDGLPWSGMFGDACYIYNRKPTNNGLVVHNHDGTGFRLSDGGLVSFGHRLLRANRMVAELPAGTTVAASPSNVRFGAGASNLDSDLSLGYYNPTFNNEVTLWKVRSKGSDGGFAVLNWATATEDPTKSLYCDTSGHWSLNCVPTGQALTVNGPTWLGTGAGNLGKGLVLDGSAGVGSIGLPGAASGGNKFALTLTGYGTDFFEFGRNSANPLARIYGDGSVVLNQAALATGATAGFTYLPSCAGTPTGTPSIYPGMSGVPTIIDTVGSKLCCYFGGSWKSTPLT